MRSEFFNQIKQSRKNYYQQFGNTVKEKTELKKKVSNPIFKASEVKSRRWTFPKFNIVLPEKHKIKLFFVGLKQGFKKRFTITKHMLKIWGKPVKSKIEEWNGRLKQKTDHLIEGFYERVIVLFEDESSDKDRNSIQNVVDEQTIQHFPENALTKWIRRIWSGFLVSLELDEAINEIIVARLQKSNIQKPTTKSESKIRKFRERLNTLILTGVKLTRKYIRHKSLQPIINRFIL